MSATPPDDAAPVSSGPLARPYLRPSSMAFRYHALRWSGRHTRARAVAALGVPVMATARTWEHRLRIAWADALGVPVEELDYIGALRWHFDGEHRTREAQRAT